MTELIRGGGPVRKAVSVSDARRATLQEVVIPPLAGLDSVNFASGGLRNRLISGIPPGQKRDAGDFKGGCEGKWAVLLVGVEVSAPWWSSPYEITAGV